MAFFVMHDYPETAKFLDEDEKREVSRRLKLDRSSLADEFDMKFFYHALQDWKIWVHMFITIGVYTPLYSISLFMPTIVRGLGYTDNVAQLMTVRTESHPFVTVSRLSGHPKPALLSSESS